MARARNIKPGFFVDEDLVELSFSTRLLFIGIWTLADRAGRLPDKPKTIKMSIFPSDRVDVDKALNELSDAGCLTRYVVDGKGYIEIKNFAKHQKPHPNEADSQLPGIPVFQPMVEALQPLSDQITLNSELLSLNSELHLPSNGGTNGKAELKPSDLKTWMDAIASLLGAKDGRSVSKRRQWETVCESLIREDKDLLKFMAVVASERDRNKDTPQFFSPDSCLQIFQLNGKANGKGNSIPQWKIDQDACTLCDENGYVLNVLPHKVCKHK